MLGIEVTKSSGLPLTTFVLGDDTEGCGVTTGSVGTEVANAVRSSLSSLNLPSTGQPLDSGGMDRAVSGLERAAQALVQAANSAESSGGSSANAERATSGGAGNTRASSTE